MCFGREAKTYCERIYECTTGVTNARLWWHDIINWQVKRNLSRGGSAGVARTQTYLRSGHRSTTGKPFVKSHLIDGYFSTTRSPRPRKKTFSEALFPICLVLLGDFYKRKLKFTSRSPSHKIPLYVLHSLQFALLEFDNRFEINIFATENGRLEDLLFTYGVYQRKRELRV